MKFLHTVYLGYLITLAGCASPYVPPSEAQPGAEISAYSDGLIQVIVYNEKKCYTGQVTVPQMAPEQKKASAPLRIHAERKMVVTYEKGMGGISTPGLCRAIGGFVPARDRHYIAVGGEVKKPEEGSWLARVFSRNKDACALTVYEEQADGNMKVVDLEPLQIKQKGIACIRFEK